MCRLRWRGILRIFGHPADAVQILILLAILPLLIFGPRRGGRMPGPLAIGLGLVLIVWLAFAFGLGWLWKAIVGPVSQP
jgi:hypothetical protein